MPQPILLQTAFRCVDINALVTVARQHHVRYTGNIFHEPPGRAGLKHNATELGKHFKAVAGRLRAAGFAEIRARRATDDTIKTTSNNPKLPDVTSINEVRSTNNREALSFKSSAQKINARKKAQDEL